MKKFKTLILIHLLLFFYSCGTVKEGFKNPKKNNSDEFLVEKKSPLIMPPDFDELPKPTKEIDNFNLDKNNIERIITGSEGKYIEEDSNKDLESSILKKIKID